MNKPPSSPQSPQRPQPPHSPEMWDLLRRREALLQRMVLVTNTDEVTGGEIIEVRTPDDDVERRAVVFTKQGRVLSCRLGSREDGTGWREETIPVYNTAAAAGMDDVLKLDREIALRQREESLRAGTGSVTGRPFVTYRVPGEDPDQQFEDDGQ